MILTNQEFLETIEGFLKRTGMSASAFGRKVKNDPNFIFRLRKGQDVREEGKQKILAYMKDYELNMVKQKYEVPNENNS